MAKHQFLTRQNPQVYEINTVAWLHELSQKAGRIVTLGTAPDREWAAIRDLGTDFVWLMGVWRRSRWGKRIFEADPTTPQVAGSVLPTYTNQDIIGSAYSIEAYEPDPLVGTWEDIDRARDRLHRHAMGVILDFIPNHTGPDFDWVNSHPDYYVQGTRSDYDKDPTAFFAVTHRRKRLYLAKGKDPNFLPWSDTVQVNYFNPAARRALVAEIGKIARHCDGVRCDMAQLVLRDIFPRTWKWAQRPDQVMPQEEFWSQAINAFPDLVWIAEAYWDTEQALMDLGFNYVYDKTFYDRLRWSPAYDVYERLTTDVTFQKKLLRYIENHDEERCVTAFGRERSIAAATIVATVPGMKLYHEGQFQGKTVRLPVQIRQAAPEPPDTALADFYHRLLAITREDIFHEGEWKLKEVLPVGQDNSFRNLIAYLWKLADQTRLVVVNISADHSQGRVPLEWEVSEGTTYVLTDLLNNHPYQRRGRSLVHPGLHAILDAYHAHIFDVQPTE